MKHLTTPQFWELYKNLPSQIQELADKNFALLKQDPTHPSLHLKKVKNFWSVRIGIRYRALAFQVEEGLIWFWIGTHADYDRMVNH
jgi:mRNA-degrading endonuclease RelE of RelBE toxin-antitoxin system